MACPLPGRIRTRATSASRAARRHHGLHGPDREGARFRQRRPFPARLVRGPQVFLLAQPVPTVPPPRAPGGRAHRWAVAVLEGQAPRESALQAQRPVRHARLRAGATTGPAARPSSRATAPTQAAARRPGPRWPYTRRACRHSATVARSAPRRMSATTAAACSSSSSCPTPSPPGGDGGVLPARLCLPLLDQQARLARAQLG